MLCYSLFLPIIILCNNAKTLYYWVLQGSISCNNPHNTCYA